MTEPMHYPDYPDICGSIRSMANAVSGLGVVTKPASQIRIEKRLWEIADALEKRYKEDRARGVAQQAPDPAKYTLTLSAMRELSADVELKDYRKSCIHDPICQWLCTAGNCPFHVTLDRHNATIAAQAREDVLKEVEEYWNVGDCCYPTNHPHHQDSPLCHKTPHCIICFMRKNMSESLRHGQEQGRDPK